MSDSSNTLPEFADPPVIEVALSLQFEAVKGLQVAQLWSLWSDFRDEFPLVEEYPPIEPVIERFGVKPTNINPPFKLRMFESPPTQRYWFKKKDDTELIQVQSDRFIHNWRKTAATQIYCRYNKLSKDFERELIKFQDFLHHENLGEIIPNQCEVTYVNHILAGKGWERFGELGGILTIFKDRYSDKFLGQPEDARAVIRYEIMNDNHEPIGRLHVNIEPAFRVTDGLPMFVMSLTARIRPEGNGLDGALKSLNIGHEWVVRGFTSITTPEMHKIWRRQNAK